MTRNYMYFVSAAAKAFLNTLLNKQLLDCGLCPRLVFLLSQPLVSLLRAPSTTLSQLARKNRKHVHFHETIESTR